LAKCLGQRVEKLGGGGKARNVVSTGKKKYKSSTEKKKKKGGGGPDNGEETFRGGTCETVQGPISGREGRTAQWDGLS